MILVSSYDRASDTKRVPSLSSSGQHRHFAPTGVLLLRVVSEPFMIALSRSQNRKYWFNTQTRQSAFECPPAAAPDPGRAFASRLLWLWDETVKVKAEQEVADPPPGANKVRLQGEQVLGHIKKLAA